MRRVVDITVVVGRATVVHAKDAPKAMVFAVQLSVICTIIISPATGVPVREVVIDVIACASAVIWNISPPSVLMAGVAA